MPSMQDKHEFKVELTEEAAAEVLTRIIDEIADIKPDHNAVAVTKDESGTYFDAVLRLKLKAWQPVPEIAEKIQKKIAEAFKLNTGLDLKSLTIEFTCYFED